MQSRLIINHKQPLRMQDFESAGVGNLCFWIGSKRYLFIDWEYKPLTQAQKKKKLRRGKRIPFGVKVRILNPCPNDERLEYCLRIDKISIYE